MNNPIIKFWLKLVVLAAIVLLLQYLSKTLIIEETPDKYDFFSHGIIFLLTGLGTTIFFKVKNKYPMYSGLIFGGVSLLKVIMVLILVYPMLSDTTTSDLVFVIQFLIIYVVYLFFEIFMILNFLKFPK
ncbi:MAG: hypothetical protein ACP5DZ_03540 [Bacteroidales bacterium]